jgi:hypothetical protein
MICPLLSKECVGEQCAWWFKPWQQPNKCFIPVFALRLEYIADMRSDVIDIYNKLIDIENKLG